MEEFKILQINDFFQNKKNDKKPKKPKTVDIFKVPTGLIKKVKIQEKKVKPKEEKIIKAVKNYAQQPKEMKVEKPKNNTDRDMMIKRNSKLVSSYNY
jgi:hypothetical protein